MILKYIAAGVAAALTVSANACTIRQFAHEGLLSPSQNNPENVFQEVRAFAAGKIYGVRPMFTGNDPRFEMNLSAPIDLTPALRLGRDGFGFAVAVYLPGSDSGMDFYFISGLGPCEFTFPQNSQFWNGPIRTVYLFGAESIPDAAGSLMLFAIALTGLSVLRVRSHFLKTHV